MAEPQPRMNAVPYEELPIPVALRSLEVVRQPLAQLILRAMAGEGPRAADAAVAELREIDEIFDAFGEWGAAGFEAAGIFLPIGERMMLQARVITEGCCGGPPAARFAKENADRDADCAALRFADPQVGPTTTTTTRHHPNSLRQLAPLVMKLCPRPWVGWGLVSQS